MPISDDALDEDDETFSVVLSNGVNFTIVDDTGSARSPTTTRRRRSRSTTSPSPRATRARSSATFTATLSAASGKAVAVNYATANNSAVAPGDFTAAGGTLNFAAGVTTQTVTVNVNGDLLDEANETFFLNLSGASNATIGDGQGVGTITDDDAAPALSIGNATVTEGNTGTVDATFTASLNEASGQTVTVDYATANDSAAAGFDYQAAAGTLSFAAGDTTKTVTVPSTATRSTKTTKASSSTCPTL